MDDLEAIRQRRLQELQEQAAAGQDPAAAESARREQAAQQEAAVESLLQQILEPEARERLTRIRLSRPGFHDQVVAQLAHLARSGRLQKRLDDQGLRSLLQRLTPQNRDINITRK